MIGWAHAGHCRLADVTFRAAVGARRFGVSLDGAGCGRTGAFGRAGAPGRRMWQCGQCSGPDSIVRRHKGHVISDTSQRIRDHGASARPVSGPEEPSLTPCGSADRTGLLTRSAVSSAAAWNTAIATSGWRK